MAGIKELFDRAFRDFATDGVASSGLNQVDKPQARAIGVAIETALGNLGLAGVAEVLKDTRAHLDADLAHDEGTVALTYADATDDNNDFSVKVGDTGEGSWALTSILHDAIGALVQPRIDDLEAVAAGAAQSSVQAASSVALLFSVLGPPLTAQGRWFYAAGPNREILLATIRPGSAVRFSRTGATAYSLRYVVHPDTTDAPVFDVYINGTATGTQVALSGTANVVSTAVIASGLTSGVTYNFELRLRGLGETDPRWAQGAGPQLFDVTGGTGTTWPDDRPKDLYLGDSITGGVGGRYPGSGAYTAVRSAGDVCYGRIASELAGRSAIINGFGGASLANTAATGSGGVPCYWPGTRANTPGYYQKQGMVIQPEVFANIFVNLGTNDAGAGISDAAFKAALTALCNALKLDHPEAAIYVIRPFNGSKAIPALQASVAAGVHWIDTFGLVGMTYTDGVHPTVAGHALAGAFINNWITTPKVLANGDFSSSDLSMWLKSAGTGTLTRVSGAGVISGAYGAFCQGFTTVIGETYRVRGTCSGAGPYIQKGDDPTAQENAVTFANAPATVDNTFIATSEFSYIVLTAFTDGTFDNIQITAGPIVFTNGDFSNSDLSMWPATGASGFTGNIAIVSGHGQLTGQSQVAQPFTTVIGQTYTVHFERGGTDPYVQVANNKTATSPIKTWAPGTSPVTDTFVATSTLTYLVLSSFTDGWWDNITIS